MDIAEVEESVFAASDAKVHFLFMSLFGCIVFVICKNGSEYYGERFKHKGIKIVLEWSRLIGVMIWS